jgi:transcription elongation factor GreA
VQLQRDVRHRERVRDHDVPDAHQVLRGRPGRGRTVRLVGVLAVQELPVAGLDLPAGYCGARALGVRILVPMSEKYPMTPAGYASMKAQLLKLKNVDRPANSRAIEIARGHGDLSENADYSAAKEEQGLIEAKIRELEAKTALAEVIDPTKLSGSRVKFGATVTIEDTESGETQRYTIVGEHEADIKRGRISIGAPVARALIGKEVGDTVVVQSPKGKREYEVSEVEWLDVPPLEEVAQ